MRKTLSKIVGLLTLVFVLIGAANVASASATTPPTCKGANTTTAKGNCADVTNSSHSSASITDSSYSAVTTKGKIVLANIMEWGLSVKVQKQSKCFWVKGGWNASNDSHGNYRWIYWPWPTKICHTGKGPTGYQKVDSHDPTGATKNCGNWFRPFKWGHPSKPVLKASAVVFVRSFANVKFVGKVTARASGKASAYAKAWCNTQYSSALATGSGSASAYGYGHGSYTVVGLAKMKAWLHGSHGTAKENAQINAQANAQASAKVNAAATASAKATCKSTPPPPTCTPGSSPKCPVNGSVSASAEACVDKGASNGVVNGVVVNNDSFADSVLVTLGGKSTTVSVGASGSSGFSLSGFAPGTYTGTAKFQVANLTTSFSVTVGQCSSPPPPPSHSTSISCQVQEEITGGDASETYCTVVSDESVPSTISVTTSDSSELYVTGVECTDNGTASCDASPGHYSFVLHGVNDGSAAIYPTLTVSATANGVTTNPPFQATIKVDPSCISFC